MGICERAISTAERTINNPFRVLGDYCAKGVSRRWIRRGNFGTYFGLFWLFGICWRSISGWGQNSCWYTHVVAKSIGRADVLVRGRVWLVLSGVFVSCFDVWCAYKIMMRFANETIESKTRKTNKNKQREKQETNKSIKTKNTNTIKGHTNNYKYAWYTNKHNDTSKK